MFYLKCMILDIMENQNEQIAKYFNTYYFMVNICFFREQQTAICMLLR